MNTHQRGGGKARGAHWPGSRRHRRLCGRILKRERKNPKPMPEFGKCVRCGDSFIPDWCDKVGRFMLACDPCMLRALTAFLTEPD